MVMANIDIRELLDFTYTRLPSIYIQKDFEIDEKRPPLYNFLQAAFCPAPSGKNTGAVNTVVQKSNAFTSLVDAENCPNNAFSSLLESFGFDYNELIENKRDKDGNILIYYQRKLLINIGELYRRRGTMSAVRFMVRILTGLEVGSYKYWRGYRRNNSGVDQYGRWLDLTLQAETVSQVMSMAHSVSVIEEFIHIVLPYYINVHIEYEVDSIVIEFNTREGSKDFPQIGTAQTIAQYTEFKEE